MSASPTDVLNALARFGVASQQLSIDVGGIAQALPLIAETIDDLQFGLALDGSQLAVVAEAPFAREWIQRAGRLAQLLGTDPAIVEKMLLGRPSKSVRIELASLPKAAGLAATIRCLGDVPIDDDVNLTIAAGVSDLTRTLFLERAAFLATDPAAAGASSALSLRIALQEPVRVGVAVRVSARESELPDSMGRILAVASHLEIAEPQRHLFERIFPLIAMGTTAGAELTVTPREMRSTINLRWNAEGWPWENVVRVGSGLYANAAQRIGTFSGSLDGSTPDMLEMELGTVDPPPAWVWARYGRPTQRA